MVPLGRLSYSVYLVNITVMMMIGSRQRAAISPTTDFLVSMLCPNKNTPPTSHKKPLNKKEKSSKSSYISFYGKVFQT